MVVDEQADLRLNYVADKIQIKIIKLTPQQQLKQNQNLVYCLESDPVAAGETNQVLCFETNVTFSNHGDGIHMHGNAAKEHYTSAMLAALKEAYQQ